MSVTIRVYSASGDARFIKTQGPPNVVRADGPAKESGALPGALEFPPAHVERDDSAFRTDEYTYESIEDAERDHAAGKLPDAVLTRFREAFADPIADLLREGT